MNAHIEKIINDARDMRRHGWVWFREQPMWRQIGEIVALVLVIVVIGKHFGKHDTQEAPAQSSRVVTVAPVSELASNGDIDLPLLGTVTSRSEATIRSESSGKLTRVYKKLGDYVTAGQVIAEFDNSAERASVLQAEGAYEAAKAAKDIAQINSGNTASSLTEARTSALNAIISAYNAMDDAVRVKTDGYFNDPRFDDVHLLLSVPDAQLQYSIETQRKAIEKMLLLREQRNKTLSNTSDLLTELNQVQTEVQMVKSYLDDFFTATSKAVPDTTYNQTALDSAKAVVSVARSTIAGTISSVSGSRSALNGAIAASQVAGKTTGDSSGIATADANVKQALGAYDAALSRLEKTVIRSPISGTLNSLSIKTGDFISQFTQVAVVSNNGALEVVAYVTDDDAKRIQVGSQVLIDNGVKGVITRVASAIDPTTKKIEVRIGIIDKTSLVNGQSVRVSISKSKQAMTAGPITIPLSSLKLTPNGAYVFTVSATSSLVAIPVKDGAILGDQIQIISGLTGDERIVTDARGLKEGLVVTVKE